MIDGGKLLIFFVVEVFCGELKFEGGFTSSPGLNELCLKRTSE